MRMRDSPTRWTVVKNQVEGWDHCNWTALLAQDNISNFLLTWSDPRRVRFSVDIGTLDVSKTLCGVNQVPGYVGISSGLFLVDA
jgi:hypothetical protein